MKVLKKSINPFEERLLEGIGKRIADTPIKLENGIPKTDGYHIWLPMSDPSFSFYDLEGLIGHEAGHIRFRSYIDENIYIMLCKENVMIGKIVLNIFEDARVNFLLRQTYPGYYDELMECSKKFTKERINQLSHVSPNILKTKKAINFIIELTILYGASIGEEYIYHESLRNPDGSFKFKSKRLGKLWKKVIEAFEIMRSYFTFSSSVLASKIFIDALRDFINDSISDEKEESESEESEGIGKLDGDESGDSEDDESEESEGSGDSEDDESEESEGSEDSEDDEFDTKKRKSLADFEISEESITESTESGIFSDKLGYEESKKLKELIKKIILSETKGGEEEFKEDVKIGLEEDKKSMEDEIKKILSETENIEEKDKKYDTIFEDRNKITVDVLRELRDIKQVNHILRNTKEVYYDIVRKNGAIIHNIRVKLNNIRQNKLNARGARKGIISHRDLPQVVTSRGRFDRPFLNKVKGKGAYLVIAVDESGSMKCGKRISIAKESAIILAEALKGTRIKYSVIGFAAVCGEHRIVEKVYKGLDEELSPEKLGAIGCSNDYCENRDGTSFKGISKHHLKRLQGGIPMMIVISDGQPYHGGTEYVDTVAESDTAKTVIELKKSGIAMFALSLDTSGASYLKDIYGSNCFHVVNDASELRDRLIYMVENLVNAVK